MWLLINVLVVFFGEMGCGLGKQRGDFPLLPPTRNRRLCLKHWLDYTLDSCPTSSTVQLLFPQKQVAKPKLFSPTYLYADIHVNLSQVTHVVSPVLYCAVIPRAGKIKLGSHSWGLLWKQSVSGYSGWLAICRAIGKTPLPTLSPTAPPHPHRPADCILIGGNQNTPSLA